MKARWAIAAMLLHAACGTGNGLVGNGSGAASGSMSSTSGAVVGCAGVTCPEGEACAAGNCYPTSCGAMACPAGELCVSGICRAFAGSGSGSSSGSSAGSSSSGGVASSACGPGATFVGNYCVVSSCTPAIAGADCALIDGGVGACLGTVCGPGPTQEQGDSSNCGGAGVVCPPGAACQGGLCLSLDAGTLASCGDCPSGSTCVEGLGLLGNGGCVTTSCTAASTGQACVLQLGIGGSLGLCCGTTCADLVNDAQNCGSCGTGCPDNGYCLDGFCAGGCLTGPPGGRCMLDGGGAGTCCQGSCASPLSDDEQNCGGCGLVCAVGTFCLGGRCVASDAGTAMPCASSNCPVGSICASYLAACAVDICTAVTEGQVCELPDGGAEGTCCGTACVLEVSDSRNCGGCGATCTVDDFCLSGTCRPVVDCASAPEATECFASSGQTCCGGSCVDVRSDPANCGGCQNVCPTGATCTGDGVCSVAGTPVSCYSGTNPCPAGTACGADGSGICLPTSCAGVSDGVLCAVDGGLDWRCCGGACVNVTSDPANCGGCGLAVSVGSTCELPAPCGPTAACPTGDDCIEAQCVPEACGPLSNGDTCGLKGRLATCCNQTCAKLNEDPRNCGQCGLVCDGGACLAGVCTVTYPGTNFDCTPACGAGELCWYGACVGPTTCTAATTSSACVSVNSSGDGALGECCPDGSCADLENSVHDCGACGVVCPTGSSCAASVCG